MHPPVGTASAPPVAPFLTAQPRCPRGLRHGPRRVRALRLAVRPAAPRAPVPRAYARIEALEAWIDGQHPTPLDAKAVHEILTRVVDETHAVCDLVQSELIAAEPQPQSQSQSQSQGVQTQLQSHSSSNGGA